MRADLTTESYCFVQFVLKHHRSCLSFNWCSRLTKLNIPSLHDIGASASLFTNDREVRAELQAPPVSSQVFCLVTVWCCVDRWNARRLESDSSFQCTMIGVWFQLSMHDDRSLIPAFNARWLESDSSFQCTMIGVWFQLSSECNLLHFTAADLSCHQWTCAMTYVESIA